MLRVTARQILLNASQEAFVRVLARVAGKRS
ncbi:MAG: hypothetical protein QOJ98_465 [Acidobacteriota bacterium]|jgi:hypothetical protein|nr:hypothetical protein [Acidobacteriota bacterium]